MVARQFGITAAQLFQWRKAYLQGSLMAVGANETVVPASEQQEAMRRIKQLEGALGRKTLENEILKEAVDFAKAKKWIARSPVLPGASSEGRLLCPWRVAQPCVGHEGSTTHGVRLTSRPTATMLSVQRGICEAKAVDVGLGWGSYVESRISKLQMIRCCLMVAQPQSRPCLPPPPSSCLLYTSDAADE